MVMSLPCIECFADFLMGLLGQWVADEWKRSESKSKRCSYAISDKQSIQRRL